jgi:arylformamidase
MTIRLIHNGENFTANLAAPVDISIPLQNGSENPNCFFAPLPVFEPVRAGNFTGSTQEGGAVNFFNVHINPHGNGTHTECVGHIAKETYTINQCLRQFHSIGRLITVEPEQRGEDHVITKATLERGAGQLASPSDGSKLSNGDAFGATLIIRTLPNGADKRLRQYSNTNPPYMSAEAMEWIVTLDIEHLVVDIPSVDREVDGGVLAAHHIFWNYPAAPRLQATITELAYIENTVPDGLYLVNHQVTSIELDASPSKILLFSLQPE